MSENYTYTGKFVLSIFLGVFFISFCSISVSAQEKPFDKEKLKTLGKNSFETLKSKTYPLTTTYKRNAGENNKLVEFRKTIYEFVPPNRKHYIFEYNNFRGKNSKSVSERIEIGKEIYVKTIDDQWLEAIPRGGVGRGSGISYSGSKPVLNVEYKLMEGQIVNNQESDLYEIITTYGFKSENPEYSDIIKQRYWYNKEGLPVKTEIINIYGRTGNTGSEIKEYEYDPNIKIEVPIMK
jgi:hypothetical protein